MLRAGNEECKLFSFLVLFSLLGGLTVRGEGVKIMVYRRARL